MCTSHARSDGATTRRTAAALERFSNLARTAVLYRDNEQAIAEIEAHLVEPRATERHRCKLAHAEMRAR